MIRIGFKRAALAIFVLLAALPADGQSRSKSLPQAASQDPYLLPSPRTHYTGYLKFQVTNDGVFSAGTETFRDVCNPDAPAAGISFVSRGGIWFGGVVGRDTLVTAALDDFYPLTEFTPAPSPEGEFSERTQLDSLKRPSGSICPPPLHDPLARSDQDLEVIYTDTVVGWMYQNADPNDGRPHLPLRLSVKQRSSSWSRGYGEDITIIDYQFTNVGSKEIHDAFVGVFVDHDIGNFDDDWVGFIRDVPVEGGSLHRDTLNLVWCADNDGDPEEGGYGSLSPVRALGVRLLRTPHGSSGLSFNWWTDRWGPALRSNNPYVYPIVLGAPYGDRAKYVMMKNGELDYDQNTSAVDHSLGGWLPPVASPAWAADVADGFDSRFVLSAGPFDLPPGASEPLTLAVVAGREFHVDPGAFAKYWDPLHPQYHAERLDFAGVVRAARWAGFLFDTPGLDSDGDGYAGKYRIVDGDTVYYQGDLVPDYLEPPAPVAPAFKVTRSGTTLKLNWNGALTETGVDPYLQHPDFEGYRVYINRTGRRADYALVSQRDVIDYSRYEWHSGPGRWFLWDTPLTLDSLLVLYAPQGDELGFPFHPDSFAIPDTSRALRVVQPLANDPAALGTAYYYFEPFGGNLAVDDVALQMADSSGLSVDGVIRKVYPNARPEDIAYDDRGVAFKPYFEYEFKLSDLFMADAFYVAVTAFDFGYPAYDLDPQEVSPEVVRQFATPNMSSENAEGGRAKPGLYPNPYRVKDDYYGRGWENPLGTEPDPERARRITFYKLPEPCTISIWTLDGDLVKEIQHGTPGTGQEMWNLITRNGERVRTGLYIWSVQSQYGTDVGKLAILR